MTIKANSVDDYLTKVPADRQQAFIKLRQTILDNIPKGFEEGMQYGMIGYYVPHSSYPDGYHAKPSEPLPFTNLGNQKKHIGFYHACCYADDSLKAWFADEYAKVAKYKLDMGKSCVRFKKMDDIPYDLVGELMSKITVDEWIKIYEKNIKK